MEELGKWQWQDPGPWPYDEGKRHISRSECVALNAMAEEICKYLNDTRNLRSETIAS